MKTNPREIIIYYNPESSRDRKTVAHAQGLVPHVRTYAFGKTPSTKTSWQTIIRSLDMHPKELLNKADPYYQSHIRGKEFDDESWLKVIERNPSLIKAPIAIRGKKAILCNSAPDVYKLTSVA
ncbi:MAG: glutaredoxin [Saprospiraceae bacterium]|nr:glutaredoxin [Saprospiraceae bacterium]